MTPSTTSGVVCQLPATGDWYTHCSFRFFTLAGVIWLSGLYRWL